MASLQRLILLCVPLLLAACAPLESDTPLSPERTAQRDPRLEGLWRSTNANNAGYLYIVYGPKNTGKLMFISKDAKSTISTQQLDFFVTHTSRSDFLNVSEGTRLHPEWCFAKYQFTWNGKLIGWPVMSTPFVDLIRKKELRGKVDSDDSVSVKHAPPGRLLAIIESSKPEDLYNISDSNKPKKGPGKPTWNVTKIGPP